MLLRTCLSCTFLKGRMLSRAGKLDFDSYTDIKCKKGIIDRSFALSNINSNTTRFLKEASGCVFYDAELE